MVEIFLFTEGTPRHGRGVPDCRQRVVWTIIRILKEHEAGKKASDIVRERNISEQTFYQWKSKYGGMDVSDAKHLKQLEKKPPIKRAGGKPYSG